MQIKVTHGTRQSEHIVNIDFLPILDSLFSGDARKIAHTCLMFKDIRDAFEDIFINTIREEVKVLCLKRTNSVLRQTDLRSLIILKWDTILSEWTEKAPTFKKTLLGITSNPSHQRNKLKKEDELKRGIVSAGCKLLSVYNRELNAVQHVVSLVLLKGGCKKSAFTRLNSINDCLSYQATLNIADNFADTWTYEIKTWTKQIEDDKRVEIMYTQQIKDIRESIDLLSDEPAGAVDLIFQLSEKEKELEYHKSIMHEGFYFVGDNVDMKTNVRHMTIENQNKDQHLFQICAYKNRVSGNSLDNTKPKQDILTVPFSTLLPSLNDQEIFTNEFSFLVARTWATFIPHFRPYQNVLQPYIEHKYMKETTKKSERVSLYYICFCLFVCSVLFFFLGIFFWGGHR